MEKWQALHSDFLIQILVAALTVATIGISFLIPIVWTLGACTFIILLIYQFFSGVYLAAEHKLWYRGMLPVLLLILSTLGILFAVSNFGSGIMIILYLTPVLSIGNLSFSTFDWLKSKQEKADLQWNIRQERILDSKEVFK